MSSSFIAFNVFLFKFYQKSNFLIENVRSSRNQWNRNCQNTAKTEFWEKNPLQNTKTKTLLSCEWIYCSYQSHY